MLPFDRRPWAKTLATAVISFSFLAAIAATYVLYLNSELHIPEVLIIVLLLLTIVPPNLEIALRKKKTDSDADALPGHPLHTR